MWRAVWPAVVVGAWLVAGVPASAQTVTLPETDDTVSGLVGTVTDAVEEVVGTAGGSATDAAGGATTTGGDGSSGSEATGAGLSSSSSSSGAAAPRSSSNGGRSEQRGSRSGYRSKFDRLPRRLERLLERVELGRNVKASLRRLERLLASASPDRRAQVRRLIRAEIRRLRADGVTRAERRRVARLERAQRVLFGSPAAIEPPFTAGMLPPGVATTPAGWSAAEAPAAPSRPERGAGGVLDVQAGGAGDPAGPREFPSPRLPDRPDEFPFAVGVILLILLAVGFLGVVAGVASHVLGRMRSG